MIGSNQVRSSILAILGTFSISGHALAEASFKKIDVPPGELTIALKKLAEQSGVEFFYSTDQLKGLTTQGIRGEYTPEGAVQKLIEGTNLELTQHESGALVISMPDRTVAAGDDGAFGRFRLALTDSRSVSESGMHGDRRGTTQPAADGGSAQLRQDTPEANATSAHSASRGITEIEEVLVTGSHIRGVNNSSSPVLSFDREYLTSTGVTSVEGFIQTLPQSFGSQSGMEGLTGDTAYRPNLRGLGFNATLTLLNGRRMAPLSNSNSVDLSSIPMEAIERIDVMSDGASAIYGADAVGGVINVILRKDFEGAETRVRYGSTTQGGGAELRASQSLGTQWDSGRVLASYVYEDQSAIATLDRKLTQSVLPQPWQITPEEKSHGAVVVLTQDLSTRGEVFLDALWRSTDSLFRGSFQDPSRSTREQTSITLGARLELAEGWSGELSTTYGTSQSDGETAMPVLSAVFGSVSESKVQTIDALVNGGLFALPGGLVRVALGATYREDSQDSRSTSTSAGVVSASSNTLDRDIKSVYSELHLPLVGAANARAGARALELSIAARRDEYADVGGKTTPKFGVRWSPFDGLALRSTWGKSFRAPLLYEMDPVTMASAGQIRRR